MSERDQRILEMFNAGRMLKEIGPIVGLAPHSVGKILARLGVPRPTKPQRRWAGKPNRDEEIKALWSHGLCATQICERLSETRRCVDAAIRRLGLADRASPRQRYDGTGAVGGSGRSGFAANAARRT